MPLDLVNLLAHQRRVAELPPRGGMRLAWSHARADVSLVEQSEMRIELVSRLAVETPASPRKAKPGEDCDEAKTVRDPA